MMVKCLFSVVQLIFFTCFIWTIDCSPTATTSSPDDGDDETTIFEQSLDDFGSNIETCGSQLIQRTRRGGRVVGGQNSYPGEFPWTVS